MWRTFWIAASLGLPLLALLIAFGTQTTFLFHHPRTAGVRVEIDRRTGAAVVMTPVAAKSAPLAASSQPQARVPESTFDFGLMDPLTMGQHEFVVRNEGTAPLRLQVGPTTCKCTVSGLASGQVPPGESTTVTLTWNTGRHLLYQHAATVFTNDPAHKSLELRVTGKVRVLIGCDEPEIALGTLEPDQPTVVTRLIYSQHWQDFAIEDVQSQLPGLKWEVDDTDSVAGQSLQATAVRQLRVTIPGGLPQGAFSDTLRLTIRPSGDKPEIHHLDLPLTGYIPRRLAFYGSAIGSEGVIELGDVLEGQAARTTLLVKVRDSQLELPGAKVEVFPSYVKAQLAPVANKPGLFQLTLELPDDAPVGQFLSNPLGHVRIDSGHPRIGVVELKLAFAVAPRRGL